jgi:hypothetical protein
VIVAIATKQTVHLAAEWRPAVAPCAQHNLTAIAEWH